jgi:hypothetical protein
MTPPAALERYKNHRFPGEIISHGVWLSYRFTLSYRDVQELLFERGIDVTHEAIRQWKRNKKVALKPLLPGLTGLPLDVCSPTPHSPSWL